MRSASESPFDVRLNTVRKALSKERSVYDVISAHQALEALAAEIERLERALYEARTPPAWRGDWARLD
jgi:hypothetical protein